MKRRAAAWIEERAGLQHGIMVTAILATATAARLKPIRSLKPEAPCS